MFFLQSSHFQVRNKGKSGAGSRKRYEVIGWDMQRGTGGSDYKSNRRNKYDYLTNLYLKPHFFFRNEEKSSAFPRENADFETKNAFSLFT